MKKGEAVSAQSGDSLVIRHGTAVTGTFRAYGSPGSTSR